MLKGSGFLGTGATLGADLTLVVQILCYIAIWVGVVAQRKEKHKVHDWIMTPVVLLNLLFIAFLMVASFVEQEVARTLPQRPTDPVFLTAGIHAALGLVAEGLAIYSLLAGHQILPRKIGVLRYWMWTTMAFWSAAFLFGVGTYYVWYLRASPAAVVELPLEANIEDTRLVQQVVMESFEFLPQEITVVAGTKVIWVNRDGAPHNVTYDDGSVASENFFQGDTFSLTFDTPGTYPIYCSLHGGPGGSGMAMIVNVVEATNENLATQVAQPTPSALPSIPTPTTGEPDATEAPSPPPATEAAPAPTDTPSPSPDATPVGTPLLTPTQAAPDPTETPSPPPSPTEATPSEVIVYMDDYTYSELSLRIPVGTTVTWINRGEAQHSVTADDGSFDTGLYGTGEQASITFEVPGTFPYYCTLHGAPGGLGMAAMVIVEP